MILTKLKEDSNEAACNLWHFDGFGWSKLALGSKFDRSRQKREAYFDRSSPVKIFAKATLILAEPGKHLPSKTLMNSAALAFFLMQFLALEFLQTLCLSQASAHSIPNFHNGSNISPSSLSLSLE